MHAASMTRLSRKFDSRVEDTRNTLFLQQIATEVEEVLRREAWWVLVEVRKVLSIEVLSKTDAGLI